jgi:monofunctional biosynthetic peptidoglycan transglycosylase
MIRALGRQLGRFLALLLIALLALQLWFVLRIALMAVLDPQSTTFQRSEAWRLLHADRPMAWQQQWRDNDQISIQLKRAVIAAEDAGFSEHSGVEWDALEKAWEKNARAEAVAERANERIARQEATRKTPAPPAPARAPKVVGGSTITQQLAKNVFLGGERSLLRKAQELVIAWEMEALLGKQRILEIYLNIVELGPGIYVVTRAADHYFGKAPADLTPPEAAYLALMLPSPVRRHAQYCNGQPSEAFKIKLQRILGIMHARGRIDALDYEVYKEGDIVFDLRDRGDTGSCLAEIAALMEANEGQRALSGLLPPPEDMEIIEEAEPEAEIGFDGEVDLPSVDDEIATDDGAAAVEREAPAEADAPGRPAMDGGPTGDEDDTW